MSEIMDKPILAKGVFSATMKKLVKGCSAYTVSAIGSNVFSWTLCCLMLLTFKTTDTAGN